MGEFKGVDPRFADKSADELDAMLNSLTDTGELATEAAPPEPPAEAPAEEAPPAEEAAPAEEAPAAEAEAEPEDEIDAEVKVIESEREGDRIAREALEAKLALLEAHNSRLAGKLGFVEQKLKAIPQTSEPYEPQSQAEVDRLTSLEQSLEQFKAKTTETEVSQAIESAFNALDGPWSEDLSAEIQAIAPKYKDQIDAARESSDPALARQIATAVGLLVKAEATNDRWATSHKNLVEKKATTHAKALAAKKASTVSASGAVSSPPPKAKSYADMTAGEADAWLKANVR